MTSPSYPNPYPHLADCVYLIIQPIGTYINVSFISMDVNCHAAGSDYIEMRDGSSEDSPLMGKVCGNISVVPAFMQTTQNFLRIRQEEKYFSLSIKHTILYNRLILTSQIYIKLL